VTNNFTDDTTRLNCAKINSLGTSDLFVCLLLSHMCINWDL